MAGINTVTNLELAQRIISNQFPAPFRKATIFYDFCQKGTVSPHNGGQMTFLSAPNIAVDTTALSETATTGNELASYQFISGTATLANYGLQMPISELQATTMTEGTLTQLGDEFGDWGGRTLDTLIYNAATGNDGNGVNHYFKARQTALDTGTLTSADTLVAADLRVLRTHFKTNGVQGHSNLGGRFVLALNPVQVADLQGEAQSVSGNVTWASVNAHIPGAQGQNKILEGEGGALYGFEIKDSPTVAKVEVDTGVSGYKGLAFGKDAFVIAGMSDMKPKVRIVKPMDTNDPLQLVWKIACKFKSGFSKVDRKRSCLVYSYSA